MVKKIDILALAAHPDDAELSCSGTLLLHKSLGYSTGIIDFTKGELGTRGTAETRRIEAENASKILQLDVRENLDLGDGFFEVNEKSLLKVISAIRKYQPEIIFANAISDRHPDHGRGAELAERACFLSGLVKIKTTFDGKEQAPWRPKNVYHYIQDHYHNPNIVFDVSKFYEQKEQSILAYSTQFYNPASKEPQTPISSLQFLEFIRARARQMGRNIGAEYGEGFTTRKEVGVKDVFDLV